ncbi:BamA/TamA family outer membrane protein [Reichenbachiella sp. MSK19-1]|uniref:BamA/TamA family outer membrane protein n=1 Tax=Reichenbachiella sp. MSK19-1 TaxID=1897631 RepID=UPI000E6B6A6E|nr:BamA/TamA family outer membrane protein [Reichenbachiella sp. MSK19-1]RJE74051.1 hypothetical protein BGP76_12700 [Reichenbachiella sp. MSK19-1]
MKAWLIAITFLLLANVVKGQVGDSTIVSSVKDKKKYAFYPVVAYSPESKLNLGAIAFVVLDHEKKGETSEFYRPTSITPYVVFTTNKQILVKSEFDFFFKSGINLNFISRIYKYPDSYYGVGNDTDPEAYERYGNNYIQLVGQALKPLNSKVFYGLTFDLQYNDIQPDDGGMLEMQNPTGVSGGRNVGIGPAANYDSRNSTLYPTAGMLFKSSIGLYGRAIGGEYNYVTYNFDFRHYFELLGPKNILAYQFRANFITGDDVPFYKLNVMAGDNYLRGFDHRNVYMDRQSMYFQVEGRQDLFWRLGGVLFAGAGQVFDTFSELNAEDVRFVYGFGGRFQAMKDQKLNLRMDVGFTDNGQYAFYLSVREAF